MRTLIQTEEYLAYYNKLPEKILLLLNAFLKKSTKDYKKQIEIAETILKRFE